MDYSKLSDLKTTPDHFEEFEHFIVNGIKFRLYWSGGGFSVNHIQLKFYYGFVNDEGKFNQTSAYLFRVDDSTKNLSIHFSDDDAERELDKMLYKVAWEFSRKLAHYHLYRDRSKDFQTALIHKYLTFVKELLVSRIFKSRGNAVEYPKSIVDSLDIEDEFMFDLSGTQPLIVFDREAWNLVVDRTTMTTDEQALQFINKKILRYKEGLFVAAGGIYEPKRDNVFARRSRKVSD